MVPLLSVRVVLFFVGLLNYRTILLIFFEVQIIISLKSGLQCYSTQNSFQEKCFFLYIQTYPFRSEHRKSPISLSIHSLWNMFNIIVHFDSFTFFIEHKLFYVKLILVEYFWLYGFFFPFKKIKTGKVREFCLLKACITNSAVTNLAPS